LGHVKFSLARRWQEIHCTLPLFTRWADAIITRGEEASDVRAALEDILATSLTVADQWLAEAHGEGREVGNPSASVMKQSMDNWREVALDIIKTMKVLDPAFTQEWWATEPWGKHPTVIAEH
jgi:hypothetical protein